MSRSFDAYSIDNPDFEYNELLKEIQQNKDHQQYEQEEVCFRFISEGCHVDNEILTRKEAEKRNEIYRQFNRPSEYREYKQPQHISGILQDLFVTLQKSNPF
jgi:uncharacterized protein (DUF1697 family)